MADEKIIQGSLVKPWKNYNAFCWLWTFSIHHSHWAESKSRLVRGKSLLFLRKGGNEYICQLLCIGSNYVKWKEFSVHEKELENLEREETSVPIEQAQKSQYLSETKSQ